MRNKISLRKSLLFLISTLILSACCEVSKETKTNKEIPNDKYTILLTGASFASPNNKWFEMGCRVLDAIPLNRAVGGESIAHTANKMAEGTFYTASEFDSIDVFVIMHVHERDVFSEKNLKENYLDYQLPLDASDYAVCYDYVIRKYIADCYNQKDNPQSRYYGSHYGKPASIVLCTHWNDSRPVFNSSVRLLANKWGLPVVEFDRYIGFSKNQTHPVTGKQISLIFTGDSIETHGEVYGWHPFSGEESYIQRRMAAIFSDEMRRILLPR